MSEWREIAEWDWVQLGAGQVLHAPAEVRNDAEEDWYGEGRTECGREGEMRIPGLFSRMGAPRCQRCCSVTGMPSGVQSPKNIEACRPIVEARIAALGHDTTPITMVPAVAALHWQLSREGENA